MIFRSMIHSLLVIRKSKLPSVSIFCAWAIRTRISGGIGGHRNANPRRAVRRWPKYLSVYMVGWGSVPTSSVRGERNYDMGLRCTDCLVVVRRCSGGWSIPMPGTYGQWPAMDLAATRQSCNRRRLCLDWQLRNRRWVIPEPSMLILRFWDYLHCFFRRK